ncbi:MAG TPA: response regulator transcription factor [Bryobacteraceae bacterium]|nr:response regulator transcription factor [Bryobacteraceae bacterium]
MIRVAIAAASPVVRAGLEALVASSPGLQLANLEMPGADVVLAAGGFEATEGGGTPIVLLAADAEAGFTLDQFQTGVRAVLPPDASPAAILAAVEAVAGGLAAIDPQELEVLLGTGRPPLQSAEENGTLTPRELEVLRMMAEGAANKTIAWKLGISEHTVKFHVASILSKLRAGTRTEAVTVGIRRGLVML